MNSPRNILLSQYLISKGTYRGPMASSSFTVSYSNDWIDRLRQVKFMEGYSQFSQVGVGIKTGNDASGTLESFIVLN